MEALLRMPYPKTCDQLQQFICAAGWMRTGIPQFTTVIEPLAVLMEEIYKIAGTRKKRRLTKYALDANGWNHTHREAFENVKQALAKSVVLAHPSASKLICLFTDASDKHWSGILTQVPPNDIDLPFAEQKHQPLAFLSGSFHGASSRWSTPEKEAAAIIYSVQRLDYLLMRPEGFHIFTDHSNLIFMFNPETAATRLNRASFSKVQRWGMILAQYQYTIIHISGEQNCWADLLSRWGATEPRNKDAEKEHMRVASLCRAPLSPEYDPDFTWPNKEDFLASQAAVDDAEKLTNVLSIQDGLLKTNSGAIFIPSNDTHMQLRVCVVGHCGKAGHRGFDSTYEAIKSCFYWPSLRADVRHFCKSCLHCLATSGSQRIERPRGHAIHATKVNEVIHFDFLYMGASDTKDQYVMIIKDDLSNYTWLQASREADAFSASIALLKWFAALGTPRIWVSDRGSHFKNKLVDYINRAMHCQHHFTTPNTPHANGTVERVCREVLRCCRALLSEFRLKETEWPHVLHIVQSVLNNSVVASLGNRAPITVFTGREPDSPLKFLLPPAVAKPRAIAEVKLLQSIKIEGLHKSLEAIHRDVTERKTKQRCADVKRHNAKTFVHETNFDVGDFVLVAKRLNKDGHKLQMQWLGPQRVLREESEWVYECEDLINGKVSLVHANRLKFYADSQLNVTQELLDTIDHNDRHYNTVSRLLDLRYNRAKKCYEVQVSWRGFSHEEPTWEPIYNMEEDIPDMLRKFLESYPDKGKVQRALSSLAGVARTEREECRPAKPGPTELANGIE